jgi:transcription initiation factor IIE alpha subunit
MGAWAYCKCGEGYQPPSFAEAFIGEAVCEHCGRSRPVGEMERRIAVDAMLQRIDDLERTVRELNNKLSEEEGL